MVSTPKVRWSAIAALGALAGCGGPAAPAEDPRVVVAEVPDDSPPAATEREESALERVAREVAKGEEGQEPVGSAADPQTENWIVKLGELLPGELCKDGSFFRACFTIGQAECAATAIRHYAPCVSRHRAELPPIRDSATGRRGGEILGSCVGVAFQQDLDRQGKFTNTDKCNDPSAW